MAYIQDLLQTQREELAIQQQNYGQVGLPRGSAYSQYFPSWEVTAPQYLYPNSYSLAQLGYRKNEVCYACIDLWMRTLAEAPIKVYDKKTGEEVDNHPLTEFMENPCPPSDLSQPDFWNAVAMYLRITGFMAWEKDFSNGGDLIALWPMMPQYCSFKRGERKLLGSIHYQPYTGLPALDIPRERFAIFAYVDPLYYGLKPFSPTMVLADVIGVDNDLTKLIQQFLSNGAFISGLLKSDQLILESDAIIARERWNEAHGGVNNKTAGGVAIMGKGLDYSPVSNTFRDMVFEEVDARSEVRICMTYGVKPILISAKAGMDRSTFTNYEQARQAWYEENVMSEWRFLEERVTRDLLPEFDDDPNHVAKFDISKIKALQEDRDSTWKRANEAYKSRVVIRDEARKEMGLDPMEDEELGKELYTTAMEQYSLSQEDNLDMPNQDGGEDLTDKQIVKVTGEDKVKLGKGKIKLPASRQAKEEEKQFRNYASKRIKEDKQHLISMFEFKYISEERQRQLLNEFGARDSEAEDIVDALRYAIEQSHKGSQIINVNTSIEPSRPDIHVTAPIEMKQAPMVLDLPAPQVNINNTNAPKIEQTIQSVKRDKDGNIDGTVTKYEYGEE